MIKKEAAVRGRPRKAGVEDAVLEAIVMLVRQHGLEAVTTQMVADAAGVGRQTIYRRWPRREDMLLDALVKRTAEKLQRALDMPLGERRERWEEMIAVLRRNDITAWRERYIDALSAMPQGEC